MQSSLSIPEETHPVSPPPTPRARKPYSRFWVGFVIGFGILLLASCSGIGIALGLNQVSLAELQGNGVVWTPPPYTPAPTLQPEADVAVATGGASARFGGAQRVRNLTNSRVNVRATPGYLSKQASDVIGVLEPGATVTILGENQVADNLAWWRVQATLADGRTVEGWVAEATASGVQILGE
ncbi:MAG: SH3 domain-containing protein [Caldilineaceae bacterium]|jgi:hypothetical protein|nr:SH3 domain-containing protein [Caldilineaceae bacterium]